MYPQKAIYIYISGIYIYIYCQLGDYMLPTHLSREPGNSLHWHLIYVLAFSSRDLPPEVRLLQTPRVISPGIDGLKFFADLECQNELMPEKAIGWENRGPWWFQMFFIFTPIWGRCPIWLIFFKGVETCWNHQPVILSVVMIYTDLL